MTVFAENDANSRAPVAMITGVGGQDGTYLAQLLVSMGWDVHGITRPGGSSRPLMKHLTGVHLHAQDIAEARVAEMMMRKIEPQYVFHLAGVSSVWKSWQDPVTATRVNGVSAAALLDACLAHQEASGNRVMFVNASSAEIFAGSGETPQNEQTRMVPTSPYGASKTLSHNLVQVYRSKGLEGINAILYNHESPRRPETFVTRKITKAVAAIALGHQDSLVLGNVSIQRDWGWAPDYVRALLDMALYGKGDDFVVATGRAHTIAQFVGAAFTAAGIDDWDHLVTSDPDLTRPADAAAMVGDASKAREILGWQPTMAFEDIVAAMVDHDIRLLDGS